MEKILPQDGANKVPKNIDTFVAAALVGGLVLSGSINNEVASFDKAEQPVDTTVEMLEKQLTPDDTWLRTIEPQATAPASTESETAISPEQEALENSPFQVVGYSAPVKLVAYDREIGEWVTREVGTYDNPEIEIIGNTYRPIVNPPQTPEMVHVLNHPWLVEDGINAEEIGVDYVDLEVVEAEDGSFMVEYKPPKTVTQLEIYGHATSNIIEFGRKSFQFLDSMVLGDQVQLTTKDGALLTYQVVAIDNSTKYGNSDSASESPYISAGEAGVVILVGCDPDPENGGASYLNVVVLELLSSTLLK